MILEVLGSGGSVTTPKPFCNCSTCTEAREKGIDFYRMGPSVFLHGPNILIDTPEEISIQLNRSTITNIEACLYSHWHPDHTAGRRILSFGEDFISDPPKSKSVNVIIPQKVADTFENCLGIMQHLSFLEYNNVIKKRIIGNDEVISINNYFIKPIQLAQDYVFAYKIEGKGKSILIIMDELKNWKPDIKILKTNFDLVYLPFGIFSYNPLTDKKIISDSHYSLKDENSLLETLEIIKCLKSNIFILSHIEEPDNITIDLAKKLEDFYSNQLDKNIKIAFDQMRIEI